MNEKFTKAGSDSANLDENFTAGSKLTRVHEFRDLIKFLIFFSTIAYL